MELKTVASSFPPAEFFFRTNSYYNEIILDMLTITGLYCIKFGNMIIQLHSEVPYSQLNCAHTIELRTVTCSYIPPHYSMCSFEIVGGDIASTCVHALCIPDFNIHVPMNHMFSPDDSAP